MKKIVFLIIVIVGFVSCAKKETDLDKYLTHSDKFEKKKVTDPNGNFSLYIPKDWEFKTEYFDKKKNSNHVSWSWFFPKDGGSYYINDRIEIKKIKDSISLKKQYERYKNLNNEKGPYYGEIIDSGETNFLDYPSYFSYVSHKETSDRIRTKEQDKFEFFLKGKEEDIYYILTAVSVENENQQQNMSMMLHCLQTFEILK